MRGEPTEEEAARFGLTVEEATQVVDLWPDNLHAVNTFTSMLTQWRAGAAGLIGLDYGVLRDVLRFTLVPRSEWPQVFDDLRVMEDEALKVLREKKNG